MTAVSRSRLLGRFSDWKGRSSTRQILFWPVVVTFACGAINAGMPVDRFLESLRDAARTRAADGSIVVVKIDGRSTKALPWPSHRAVEAELTDALFDLGARSVIFGRAYANWSQAGDDDAFAQALQRHRGRVVIGTRFEIDRETGARTALLPVPTIREAASLGAYNVRLDPFGYTTGIPYSSEVGGNRYRSFASILANKDGGVDELFEPDFAIDYRTVPAVSMIDVVRRAPALASIAGKDVIVGPTADSLGDIHMVPRQGPVPGVYIHAIAAETLRRATPLELGWLPFYALSFAAACAYVRTQAGRGRLAIASATGAALAIVPVALDAWNIEVAVVPAGLLLASIIVRRYLYARKNMNPVSGLPTLIPAQHETVTWPATVVGLKLRNYMDLRATLADHEDRAVLFEIERRLRIAGDVSELMHVDDTFVWRTQLPPSQRLFDHIEGLFSIMSSPIEVQSRRVDLSFAFGIDDERERPLSNRVGNVQLAADQAGAAGAKWRVHDPKVALDSDFRLSLPSGIEEAIRSGEIWVAYQAKLDLKANNICGAEALIRWSHPELGAIRPDEFIPIVEQANRIDHLTYFVLDTAMRDARRFEEIETGFTVAVNLSARLLDDPLFAARVIAMLDRHGLAPSRLTLEITESFPLDAEGPALRTLHELRAVGIVLSIDDYGTKYSTLEYVRHMPASEIKLDQQFVRNVHINAQDAIMAESTIRLAHDLGLRVVAEGVEWPGAMHKLREMGCDVLQGYLIARPAPFDNVFQFIGNIAFQRKANNYHIAN